MAKLINYSMEFKQKVASCDSQMQKIGGLWVSAIEEPIFHQRMCGLWVTAETISKNMGSLSDSCTENRGSLEPYIRVTSIMGVLHPRHLHNESAPGGHDLSSMMICNTMGKTLSNIDKIHVKSWTSQPIPSH